MKTIKANFYYNYHGVGDVLMCVINNALNPTEIVNDEDVTFIYHNDNLIGINIFNVSNFCKIKSAGVLYLPPKALIEMINRKLSKHDIKLSIEINSLIYIGKIIEINDNKLLVDILSRKIEVKTNQKITNLNQLCVLGLENALLPSGKILNQNQLCTYRDLNINDSDEYVFILENEAKIGEDFFLLKGE